MIFDVRAANEAKLAGMALAWENAPDDWKDEADAVVEHLARTRDEFTADDVWAILWQPPEPRALGPVMARAAKARIIEKAGRTRNSARPVAHASPLTVWRSLLYATRIFP